ATLDPKSGVFDWTPDYTEQGLYKVSFTVSDGKASATQSMVIVVTPADAAPVFQTLTSFQVLENQQLQFSAQALDPNNPGYTPPTRNADGSLAQNDLGQATLTYTATGLPAGAKFDTTTLLFTWTPSYDQVGPFPVTFTATKTGSNSALLSA